MIEAVLLTLAVTVQATALTMPVSGIVRDPSGAGVPGASVVVRSANGGAEVRAVTSADGRFAVTVTQGAVDVVVEALWVT